MNPAASGAGYSKRSLADKLGMKSGMRVAVLNAPDGYPALDGMTLVDLSAGALDFIHLFTNSRADLEAAFPKLKAALAANGMVWISWYKKSAKLPTDLDENIIREMGLAIGLVDVKVAAVDEVWSALKFVYRLKDR
jgi:hypothetical protein